MIPQTIIGVILFSSIINNKLTSNDNINTMKNLEI